MELEHSSPRVSVVLPVRHGGADLRRCLTSIARNDPPPNEVIVVIDGEQEEDRQTARLFATRVIELPFCGGPARARNIGAQSAKSEILFFVDADVTIPSDAVGRVAREFRDNPELGALIGSYDDQPAGANFLSQYKNLFHHYVHQTSREEAGTFWGACGAIRKRTFLRIGGFDEHYRAACVEDIELGHRLTDAGEKIRLLKTLQVKHCKIWTTRSLLIADFFHRALPWADLILRSRRAPNDLNLTLSSRLSVILVFGLLASLMACLWSWWALAASALIIPALLCLNYPVYRFFWRKRGFWFSLKTIPWHWFYYLYGGLAFALSVGRHVGRRLAPDRRKAGVALEPQSLSPRSTKLTEV